MAECLYIHSWSYFHSPKCPNGYGGRKQHGISIGPSNGSDVGERESAISEVSRRDLSLHAQPLQPVELYCYLKHTLLLNTHTHTERGTIMVRCTEARLYRNPSLPRACVCISPQNNWGTGQEHIPNAAQSMYLLYSLIVCGQPSLNSWKLSEGRPHTIIPCTTMQMYLRQAWVLYVLHFGCVISL